MPIEITPGLPKGSIFLPTSKSMAHRAILLASLAKGKSQIGPVSFSKDIEATIAGMRAFGASIETKGERLEIEGANLVSKDRDIPVKESGSTLRFLFPVAALQGGKTIFSGEGRLMQRPMEIYESIWKEQGLFYEKKENYIVSQGRLKSGEYCVSGNVSSQFLSGLFMALPLLSGDSFLRILPPFASQPYVWMTLSIMRQFGVIVEEKAPLYFRIPGNQIYHGAEIEIEPDASQAAFFLVANALGAKVSLPGFREKSCQGDAKIKEFLSSGTKAFDIEDTPDLGPILMVYGALRNDQKETVLTGAARLRMKESDRIAAMEKELKKLGVAIQSSKDRVCIKKSKIVAPKEALLGHNDHRVVMSLAIAALFADGPVVIKGTSAVSKSYPSFFQDLKSLGVSLRFF